MPYIPSDRVEVIQSPSDIETSGELNYFLTRVILTYLKKKGLKYATCNDIIGALDCCKEEFRRRVIDPYEDLKRSENVDIYNCLK